MVFQEEFFKSTVMFEILTPEKIKIKKAEEAKKRTENGIDYNRSMLEINNLTKIYPTPKGDYVVLEDLNLKVEKEEFISIIGH